MIEDHHNSPSKAKAHHLHERLAAKGKIEKWLHFWMHIGGFFGTGKSFVMIAFKEANWRISKFPIEGAMFYLYVRWVFGVLIF